MVNCTTTLPIEKLYTRDGREPHETVEWGKRSVRSLDSAGKIVHDIKDVEFPKTWSDLAVKVVAPKFLYKGNGSEYQERSVKDLVYRVAKAISAQGVKQGYFTEEDARRFKDELSHMDMHQRHSFNSPVWFNVGLHDEYGVTEGSSASSSHWAIIEDGTFSSTVDAYERPQASACFIQSIQDHMSSIMDNAKKEAMLFKLGSGTGTNFSTLRGVNEPLSGGGVASGSTSFLRIYDIVAGRIQSGGKTRRAAKMVILNCDHPDIYRFVLWKVNEERKALWLSINPEWGPLDAADLESEAYKTVDGQNGNNSVRVTDKFMEAALAGRNWDLNYITANKYPEEKEIPLSEYKDDRCLPDKRFLKRVTNKRKTVDAAELLETIARAAAAVGDPGIQYDDNINKWNTCPNSGKINASNPCSEYMFLDDSACNLASLNLTKFSAKDGFDIEGFKHAVRMSAIAQDIIIDYASYPSKEVAENSHKFRAIGLGYTDLGALLMENGIAYDSEEGRAIAAAVTSLMTGYAYLTSAELAEKKGAFAEFEKNRAPMLDVIKMHRDATKKIKKDLKVKGLAALVEEAEKVWEEVVQRGQKHGFRNAQVTLLAPTGTIGFMMDVDCTGIEPMYGLKVTKGLAGGGSLEFDTGSCVVKGLYALGYQENETNKILEYISKNGTVVDAPFLKKEHYSVFATASGADNMISVDGHLNMMAAVQPLLSGAISKTVNLPKGAGVEDIKKTYIKAWKLGLKSVSPYIDGSKGIQPINVLQKGTDAKELKWGERDRLISRHTPDNRVKVKINGTPVHFIFGEYDNRVPSDSFGDIFVLFGSSGSPFSAIYVSWAKELSRARQSGAPMDSIIEHNRGATGTIAGWTDHPFISKCSSIEDMFAKLLQLEYLGDTSVCDKVPTPNQMKELRCNVLARERRRQHYQSRIDFIDSIMNESKLVPVFPLLEDKAERGSIPGGEIFCTVCGHQTVLSGANCRKCLNCGHAPGCG